MGRARSATPPPAAATLEPAAAEPIDDTLVDSGNDTDSDVERDLVKALAQRATDPFIKQRKARGRFIFIKVAGCEGFHCYEDELQERLAGVGIKLASAAEQAQPLER